MISTLSVLGPIFSTWKLSKRKQEFYGPKRDVHFFSDLHCPRPYRKEHRTLKICRKFSVGYSVNKCNKYEIMHL
jgi:hypothetical protein